MRKRNPSKNFSAWASAWTAFLCTGWQVLLVDRVEAGCAPHPIAIKISNVTLSNNSTARGLGLSIGSPEQKFAFLPQWPLNNTMVYGTSGFCELRSESWSQAGCTTFRGGEYDIIASNTRKLSSENAHPVDAANFPQMTFVADTVKVNENVSLPNFPLGIPLSSWGEQGYHPMMAVGMGENSTLLNTLRASGKIASRVYGIFWGRTSARGNTELDGSMVLGGYDRAKVSGQHYTQSLSSDRTNCATGMLVTITDMVLNFLNGTNISLFPPASTTSISACIVPDYPVLMTLPLYPYFANFRQYTGANITGRSFGINFFSMRYTQTDIPYSGDLTIKLQSGLNVRVPNDQLVTPDVYSDAQTGEWVANATEPNLVINAIQQVNSDDLSQLGRQFLGAAYLMVNQERGEFTLWSANPTRAEDLVAFDEKGNEADSICSITPVADPFNNGGNKTPEPAREKQPSASLPIGVIVGISVGSVAAIVIAVGLCLWWCRRRRAPGEKKEPEPPREGFAEDLVEITYAPQGAYYKHELHDTSEKFPRELHGYTVGPRPDQRYELA